MGEAFGPYVHVKFHMYIYIYICMYIDMYVDVCIYIYNIFIFMYTYTYMIRVHIHCIYKHLCCLSVISFEKCLERLLKDHFVPGFAGCGLAALYIIYASFGIILTLDLHNLCILFFIV